MVLHNTRDASVPPVAGMTGTATPVWFGAPERPLSGWVHMPQGNVARGGAVLCAPLAREQDIARYTFRRLAEELSARGVITLCFDYDGTGDSAGDDEDPGRVAAWLRSVDQAAEFLRHCGATSVTLIGMRAGALLAASAARTAHAAGLVLWDPCKSGRSFVREQHALHRLQFGPSVVMDGQIEIPGFVLSAETAADIGWLEPDIIGSPVQRTLILTRGEQPTPAPLAEHLAGREVEFEEANGQELLLEGSGANQEIPLAAIERIATWVADALPPEGSPVQLDATITKFVGRHDGEEIVEWARRIGPSQLFGIETHHARRSVGPTIIFINTAYGTHVGLNRLWVDLARRWAAAGLRCFRLDLSGLGDSPSRPGHPEHVVRSPVAFDDLFDVTQALCPEDPTNVVFIGLCAGGYQALEAAVAVGAKGVCVVNPVLRFRPPELGDGPIDPRRRLCRPTTNVSRVARRLPDVPLLSRTRMRTWREVGFSGSLKAQPSWVQELVDSGVETLCICGEDEANAIEVEMSTADHHDGFEVQLVPELDHALLPAHQRVEVIARLTDHVLTHFARRPITSRAVSPREHSTSATRPA